VNIAAGDDGCGKGGPWAAGRKIMDPSELDPDLESEACKFGSGYRHVVSRFRQFLQAGDSSPHLIRRDLHV
jgi:hypothetical protein